MEQVRLRQTARAKYHTEIFQGYDHRRSIDDGRLLSRQRARLSWYDACNLSSDHYPLLTVRRQRMVSQTLDGCPIDGFNVIGVCERERPLLLYEDGSVCCGGKWFQLLEPTPYPIPQPNPLGEVTVTDEDEFLACYSTAGWYRFTFNRREEFWEVDFQEHGGHAWTPAEYTEVQLADVGLWTTWQPDDGDVFTVLVRATVDLTVRRQLVAMGAFVVIWPDKKYINAERLATVASTALLREGEDYGSLEQENLITGNAQTVTLALCNAQGELYTDVTASDTAPQDGYWIDTSEDERSLKQYSASMGAWIAVPSVFVKVTATGLARLLNEGDAVTVDYAGPQDDTSEDALSAARLLDGSHYLYRRPDDNSFVIAGIFTPTSGGSYTITLTRGTGTQQPFLRVRRTAPEMDFVVECGNRLWGCYYGQRGGKLYNEIYASKLGDFKNWNVFQGLSTDSYAASRGTDGPFTGAAVLDGRPLFFRERVLEKVFPSQYGAHQIQTQTMDGVQKGCDRSLCVIDGRLYYKGVDGIYGYTGTLPVRISAPLGEVQYSAAEAGRCGKKLYVAMVRDQGSEDSGQWKVDSGGRARREASPLGLLAPTSALAGDGTRPAEAVSAFPTGENGGTGNPSPTGAVQGGEILRFAQNDMDGGEIRLFVYDTSSGLWQQEDAPWDAQADDNRVRMAAFAGGLYLIADDGAYQVDGRQDSGSVQWYAETGPLGLDETDKKYVTRLALRYKLEQGAALRVYIEYDDSGHWQRAAALHGNRMQSGVLRILPRRCDTFRLRLEGVGGLTLYAASVEHAHGSEL